MAPAHHRTLFATRSCSTARIVCVIAALVMFGACNRPETANESSSVPEVPLGTSINFGLGGNSEPYKRSGWSKTEEKFTWSEGTSAQLRFRIAPTEDTITLKIRIAALIKPPELPFQPVEVYVNDQKIAEWQVGNTSEFTAAIPHDVTKAGGALNIEFKTPKATSPKALELSADARVLGICCFDLEFSKS